MVPVLCVPPLALFAPDQLPLAVHDDGLLVALQVIVALLPTLIVDGLMDNDTAGALGNTSIATASKLLPEPLAQVNLNVYAFMVLSGPTD